MYDVIAIYFTLQIDCVGKKRNCLYCLLKYGTIAVELYAPLLTQYQLKTLIK